MQVGDFSLEDDGEPWFEEEVNNAAEGQQPSQLDPRMPLRFLEAWVACQEP